MVMLNGKVTRKILLGLCALLAFTAGAKADVTARVDRPSVDLNESFVLEIMVDSNIDIEPDLSVLDESFIAGNSVSSATPRSLTVKYVAVGHGQSH